MVKFKISWFDQRSMALILQSFYERNRATQHWQGKRWNNLLLAFLFSIVLCLSLCIVTPVQADFVDIPGLTDTQLAVATGVDSFCGSLAGSGTPLNDSLCVDGFRGGINSGNTTDAEGRKGLQWIAYEEAITQGTSSIETSNIQFTNIGARLATLRGGARGLAFNIKEKPLYKTMYASRSPGGAGSYSELSIFSRLGFFLNGTLTLGDKDLTDRESGFDFDTKGIIAGSDYRLTDDFVLGAAFGYVNTGADLH